MYIRPLYIKLCGDLREKKMERKRSKDKFADNWMKPGKGHDEPVYRDNVRI